MKGSENVGRFNLIDDYWILVLDNDGITREISLRQLLSDTKSYKDLAGEMKTQDFAVMRIILAILQTVFSRFDSQGNPYEYIEVDDNYKQVSDIDEDDLDDYTDDLLNTWEYLWNAGRFPQIVIDYLDKWHDRFYLFDDTYPFLQVTEDIIRNNTKNNKGTDINLKNINRTLTESNNKISLFASKDSANKNIANEAEIARWLITYHGYTGTGDKTKFLNIKDEFSPAKGWLYDIGGIYFTGQNLFETLMLNLVLDHPYGFNENIQKPAWEYSPLEVIDKAINISYVNNLSELYTRYSRAIFIEPDSDLSNDFSIEVVKLADLEHKNQNLELMTTWRFNKSGQNKDAFTPKKHSRDVGLWRSFGLMALNPNTKDIWKVGLMKHLESIKSIIGNYDFTINAISMEDDGNATSWVPVNEIYDYLNINDIVATDLSSNGWVIRIDDIVNETKEIVELTYKRFLKEIKLIRNQQSDSFVDQNVDSLYFLLNNPFKEWIISINANDDKDKKIFEWRKTLEKIVRSEAEKVLANANNRDYLGIVIDEKTHNIITAYNSFNYFLNQKLRKEA